MARIAQVQELLSVLELHLKAEVLPAGIAEPENGRQSPTGEPLDSSITSRPTMSFSPLLVTVKSQSLLVLLMLLLGAVKVAAATLWLPKKVGTKTKDKVSAPVAIYLSIVLGMFGDIG